MKDKDYLFRLISSKDVLLFIGAGFSILYGLPSGKLSVNDNILDSSCFEVSTMELNALI
jgi:hypothetical protein